MPRTPFTQPDGFKLLPAYFSVEAQRQLVDAVLKSFETHPLYQPTMPRTGQPLSVKMSNFGPLGWISDKAGYRYEPDHPVTRTPFAPMPRALLDLWQAVGDWPDPPEACLINWYGEGARMGLHVDADETAEFAPVVSVSLGDRARFRLGGPSRKDPTRSFVLSSGDVVVLSGASRRCHHGVDRIYPATSTLLPQAWRPGRLNLTLRRVNN
jgi:alkylated DNA repair protein (DNA oxidative demethylase)